MKKNILKAFTVMSVLCFSTMAFAGSATIDGPKTFGGGTFAPSAKVKIKVVSSTSAYAATSQHLNGKKMFGTNNVDPKIYYNLTVASESDYPTAPANENEGFTGAGWTSY